jgi:hypothetical protein
MPALEFDQRRAVPLRQTSHQDGVSDEGGLRL